MRNEIFAVCSAVAMASLVGTAQAPPGQVPERPQAAAAQTLTLTGCLQPWNPGAVAPGVTTPPGADNPQFVITDAEVVGDAGSLTPSASAPERPGDEGATTPGQAHATYLVRAAEPGVNFARYVNQKVELVGRLAPDPEADRAPGARPERPIDPPSPGVPDREAFTAVSLSVTSIKMVASSCS